MKPLLEFTNTMKNKLLFDLFPNELPIFLEHLEKVCIDLETNKESYSQEWDTAFMPFSYWLSLSNATMDIIKKHSYNMKKSSKVFSDQLFYTYTSLFVIDRIIKFAERSKDDKFKLAVVLLYC
ncbi:hypothetical protein OQY15_09680 [Pedobacter sp. MC2016-15]|uniref:hypothetical protein n=1 Tax=Pedobacter sp. MC2016-15 TaxID=2994473 RepID=UPI0022457F7C|nr:hypothetical protein [Pedobacter sp. MC2016-15]MCX2479359.1 hypothetical protein [Pedobacter sp. MC2016-15]